MILQDIVENVWFLSVIYYRYRYFRTLNVFNLYEKLLYIII